MTTNQAAASPQNIGAAIDAKPALPTRQENCPTHGDYTSTNYIGKIWSRCAACVRQEREEEAQRAKDAERKETTDRLMRFSGLAGRFAEATFSTYEASTPEQAAALQACRDYVKNFGDGSPNLFLIGPPGTGKSHLGSAMVHALIMERQRQGLIYSGREIIRWLRSTWGKHEYRGSAVSEYQMPSTETDMIEFFGSAPLLVLDEVGVQFGTDAETVQLLDVIDMRYKYELPTVILSNVGLPDPAKKDAPNLRKVLGDRSFDRLREGAISIACQWKSHRVPARREQA